MSKPAWHKDKPKPKAINIDEAYEKVIKEMVARKENDKILDTELSKVEKIDKKIEWYEKKISELEAQKQKEIKRFSELLDLAMKTTHIKPNGYFIKPDDRRKVEVKSVPDFLKWLKVNKEPQVILEFFNDALKKTKLSEFANREANHQRINGVINPKIDGIDFGEIQYTKYKTGYKKRR